MIRIIKRNKVKTILFFLFLFFIYWFCMRSIIEAKIDKISVQNIKEVESIKEDGQAYWGLSKEQVKEIGENPENYRIVNFHIDIKNKSGTRDLFYVKFKPIYSGNFKNINIGKFNDDMVRAYPLAYYAGKHSKKDERFIVNSEGKSDKEIIDSAKKVSFLITGRGAGKLGILDFGYSINWCSCMN